MSEPPKKRLRQSTLREGFQKQKSLQENNLEEGFDLKMSSPEERREKSAKAATARLECKSPDKTPTHEIEYRDLVDLDKTPTTRSKTQNSKKTDISENVTPGTSKGQGTSDGDSPMEEGATNIDDSQGASNMDDSQGAASMMTDSQSSVTSATEEDKFYDEESVEQIHAEEERQLQGKKKDGTPSKGIPKTELRTTPSCASKLNNLHSNDRHTVLFKTDSVTGKSPPKPWPKEYHDKWDNDHVKLPCSRENLYPVEGKGGKKEIKDRWEVIQEALLNDIMTTEDLEIAIKSYNTRYAHKWDFGGLHLFINELMDVKECDEFFENILPFMKKLTLRMPELCTQGIPLLRKHRQHTVTFSQEQLACVLANAFFCTFPRRNAHGKTSEYSSYPDINFNQLFVTSTRGNNRKAEKLKCIINYFRRIMIKMPTGSVSFRRQVIGKFPDWKTCHERLTKLHVAAQGNIEDDGTGMLQVDFANKFLGGGVLGYGCVQEEIRFLICPEMLVSRLITEVLDKNECLIMTGTERFSDYTGYASSFQWAGDHVDQIPRDAWGRRYTEVVGIDALVFHSYNQQFYNSYVTRELNKAYCGFMSPGISEEHLSAVATGNWGCGAFGGDLKLKALIQLMAASVAKRDVCYFTFQDCELRDDLFNIHTFITKKNLSISDVVAMISMYERQLNKSKRTHMNLYDFIYQTYHNTDYDTDTTEEHSMGGDSPEAQYWKDQQQPSPDYAASTP